MADNSAIEWTDTTWQPITGCSVISPGCTNCYAMKLAGGRLRSHPSRAGLARETKAGPVWTGEVRLNEGWLTQPLRWTRPRKIFVCAHGDPFHEDVPYEWVDKVFAGMALAPHHTYQVLTKRSGRMRDYLEAFAEGQRHVLGEASDLAGCRLLADELLPEDDDGRLRPLANVLMGASVEDQPRADERRGDLSAIADAGWPTFVSYEPALGPVDWRGWEFLRWLISGGESGPGARPHHPDWHRAARDFAGANGIPYLFKQWGAFHPSDGHAPTDRCPDTPEAIHVSGEREYRPSVQFQLISIPGNGWAGMCPIGKKAAGRLLDGREHNDFPVLQELRDVA